jgi:hypothetical protein
VRWFLRSALSIEVSLPLEIEPDEILLRSLRKRDVDRAAWRVKAGSLKPGSGGGSDVSLIRQRIGEAASRAAAVDNVHGEGFWGFGAATASALLEHAKSVTDDRVTFVGHANLDLGFEIPAGPPNTPPEMTEAYEEGMRRLVALAHEFNVQEDLELLPE